MRTCLVKSLGWGRVLPKVGCSGRGRIGWGDVRKCRGAVEANEEATTSVSVIEDTIDFLKKDLVHLFDDKGIDESRYDDVVEFQDPLTNYSSLQGYLFNIAMLKTLFAPVYEMHDIRATGENEITARWTMTMQFTWNGPIRGFWNPKLVVTGISIYGLNEENGKINKHIDLWDSINNQQFFSLEAFQQVLGQLLSLVATPDLETVEYKVLKKWKNYEVRDYPSFLVAETSLKNSNGTNVNPAMDGSRAFQELAGYIFGKNKTGDKMEMTTPVFSTSAGKMQFVIGSEFKNATSLPEPESSGVECKSASGGLYAVSSFTGLALEADVDREFMKLKKAMLVDNLVPGEDWILARYNDPFVNPAIRRNEILIPIEDGFSLW